MRRRHPSRGRRDGSARRQRGPRDPVRPEVTGSPPAARPRLAPAAVAVAAGSGVLLLAASAAGPYGWFIDELYYLACARRLDWGYVDHPPLSIAVLASVRAVAGDQLWAVRVPAALAVSGTALVAALLARRMGAAGFAQFLAALCVCASPLALVLGTFFSMNAFELVLWPTAALLVVRIVDEDRPRGWVAFGLLIGLALLNKHTSVLFAGAVSAALLLVPARRHLLTPWPWLGAAAVVVVLAPNLAWQAAHGWPSLEFYRNAQRLKNIPTPPLKALADQVLFAGPGALPVWLAGLVFLLRGRGGPGGRVLGGAYVLLLALLVASGSSRPDRIGAFYPILFAAGGVALARATERRGRAWWRPAAVGVVSASLVFVAPITLPLLPPEKVAAYAQATGVLPRIERGKTSPIPQWLADRTGWPEFVADMASAVAALPPEDRARAVLFAPSYGQAGALELLGPERGLRQPVISNHNTYHLWSTGRTDAEVLVAAGARERDLHMLYEEVREVGVHHCVYCMSWRDGMRLHVARGAREPLSRSWPARRHFE